MTHSSLTREIREQLFEIKCSVARHYHNRTESLTAIVRSQGTCIPIRSLKNVSKNI